MAFLERGSAMSPVGPNAKCRPSALMVAIRGEADIALCGGDFAF